MATSPLQVSGSTTIGATKEELKVSSSSLVGENDLLIVGPGVLGRLVAQKWRQEHPECQIRGQTVTADHHEELIEMGINPSLKGTETTNKFPYVIFCAPPSRSPNYAGDVSTIGCVAKQISPPKVVWVPAMYVVSVGDSRVDLSKWDWLQIRDEDHWWEAALSWNGEGSFLFTSSSAPYDCNDNGECDEDTPVVPIGRSPRTDVLLKAEKVVLEFGGCVVRLAGLYISFMKSNIQDNIDLNNAYKADRGAHTYWLGKGIVEMRPDHILNLIHYEDAASLAVTILNKRLRGRIFLGCDNHPLSRQEVMDLVNKSGKFSKKFEAFTGVDDPLGKKLNNTKTRQELGWEPKYPSFAHFLETL
ncbi:hypothetical protein TIFTF001_015670 [Ficus carica]|uniref:NAD(P)-binding Rossmann-fold superfamily protein n=1 Tax=Ficus carica TaxID=3494 RepID=A0AA88D6S2_FICCA|nr:hypothetical protein TIFTF001_015670 [Ficus carica]